MPATTTRPATATCHDKVIKRSPNLFALDPLPPSVSDPPRRHSAEFLARQITLFLHFLKPLSGACSSRIAKLISDLRGPDHGRVAVPHVPEHVDVRHGRFPPWHYLGYLCHPAYYHRSVNCVSHLTNGLQTTKWLGYRHSSNDSPGVLAVSEEAAGRGYGPRPVGRGTTTMFDNNAAADKSRQTAAEQIGINARDVLAGRWDDIHMEAGE